MANHSANLVLSDQDYLPAQGRETAAAPIRLAVPVAPASGLRSRTIISLVLLSVTVHGALLWSGYQSEQHIAPAQPKEMSIEFAAEAAPPAPSPEPAPIEPPPAVEDTEAMAPPKPVPPKARPAKPKPVPVAKPVEPAQPSAPVAAPSAAPAPSPTPAPAPAPAKEVAAVSGLASLGNPAPAYPQLALRRLWEGRVELRISVTAEGRAASVSVSRSSGHELLDDAAVETVRTWKFLPAKRGDTAVPGTATQVIDFKLPK